MKEMGWRNEYELGIPAMDLQHQRIFDCLRTIAGGSTKHDSLLAEFAVVRLLTFLQQHAELEESMMRNFGYPGLERHMEEHRRFHDDMHELAQKAIRAKKSLSLAVVKVFHLRQKEHLMTSDRDYVEYFLGPRHGGWWHTTWGAPAYAGAGAGMARELLGLEDMVHGESLAEFA